MPTPRIEVIEVGVMGPAGLDGTSAVTTHAALLNAHGQAQVSLAANQNITSTTAVAVSDLTFAIAANERWAFEFHYTTYMSTGTGGIKFGMRAPVGATITTMFDGTTTSDSAFTVDKTIASEGVTAKTWGAFGTVNGIVHARGVVQNSTTAGYIWMTVELVTGGNVAVLEVRVTHMTAKRIA